MSQYTKGEWKYINGNIDNGSHIIVTMNNIGGKVIADAHLIAAAPEMYEALFIGLDLVMQKLYEHPDDEVSQAQKVVIDKALAKAEGRA